VAFHDAGGDIDVLRVHGVCLGVILKGQCFADLGQDWILWGRVIVVDLERMDLYFGWTFTFSSAHAGAFSTMKTIIFRLGVAILK